MSKTKYVFNPKTGTMEQVKGVVQEPIKASSTPPPQQSKVDEKDVKKLDLSTVKPNVDLNENIVKFRESSDLTIFQIVEEKSRKPMMVISGYGLEIKFNMGELRTTERIEQLLGGLSDLFRTLIVKQALTKSDK